MEKQRKFLKKSDILIILGILLISLIFFLFQSLRPSGEEIPATIYVYGEAYAEVDLASHRGEETYAIDADLHVEIRLRDGEIWFEYSECPDQICVNTGVLSRSAQMAACLPADVVIVVE